MRNVAVRWAGGKFAQDIEVAGHRIRSDEEAEKGGEDTGATPHELLLAALGSCTAMTLKVYAERKGWPLEDVKVTLNGANREGGYIITRQVAIRRRSRRRAAAAPARDRGQVSRPPDAHGRDHHQHDGGVKHEQGHHQALLEWRDHRGVAAVALRAFRDLRARAAEGVRSAPAAVGDPRRASTPRRSSTKSSAVRREHCRSSASRQRQNSSGIRTISPPAG